MTTEEKPSSRCTKCGCSLDDYPITFSFFNQHSQDPHSAYDYVGKLCDSCYLAVGGPDKFGGAAKVKCEKCFRLIDQTKGEPVYNLSQGGKQVINCCCQDCIDVIVSNGREQGWHFSGAVPE